MANVRDKLLDFVTAARAEKDPSAAIEASCRKLRKSEMENALLECGIIPESYRHDSSEEKLWAKICDCLLAQALERLGFEVEVIRARANSADVRAKVDGHSLVADAKGFRLSRTAKNAKDFKVAALDGWRTGANFACLVAPRKSYPDGQVFKQAVKSAYCGTPRRLQRFYVLSKVYGPYTCRSHTVCEVLRPRVKLRPEDIRVNRHDRRRAGIPRPSRTSSSEDTAAWLAAVRAAYKVGFML